MGREVRQRGKQSLHSEEGANKAFISEEVVSVTEAEKDIFYGGQDRRITVNDSGLKIREDKLNLDGEFKYKNETDTVVKHEVPVGVIIAFDVFNNPVVGPEKMGRVTIKVNGDTFAWHGPELSSFSKKDEVIDWLSNLLYANTLFPNGIVFEWDDIEAGLE